jgi:UPF0755 protein
VLKVMFSVLVLAIITTAIGYHQLHTTIHSPLNVASNTQFEVKKGIGFNQLCQQWQANSWLDSCWRYQLVAKLDPSLTELKAGLYELTNDTVLNNIKKINSGQQISFSFTIIEGQALREVLSALREADNLKYDLDPTQLGQQIIGQDTHLEGWLFPETYHYHHNDTASSVLQRAAKKMQQILAAAWQQRADDLPYKTSYEALIMASIIEKETGLACERPLIASAFVNRLNSNMRLQTDPTVIYGLGERFDGDIKRKDLREHTPYNTYRINGLPPTPIAMPSKAAILAAVNPPKTAYVYFVSKGDGSHQFSTTLQQHNAAVKTYILNNKN